MSLAQIDFAPRRPVPLAQWAAGALLLVLAAWGLWRYVDARQAAAQARGQLEARRSQLAREAARPGKPAPVLGAEQVKAVNDAVQALNVPWPAVLGAMEASRTPAVALLRVEPRPKDRVVLITAQADDMDALVAYMRKVARTPPFARVMPVRQEVLVEGSGPPRRQATFEARWEDRP